MENDKIKTSVFLLILKVVAILAFLFVIGYGAYQYYLTYGELKITRQELSAAKMAFTGRVSALEKNVAALEKELGLKETENASLSQTLTSEKDKNNLFESQIQAIGGTVGNLTKLSQTDKELLQKYSKIYFLNEHYVPENLTAIDPKYVYEKNKALQFHTSAYPYLVRMLEEATTTNPIQIISAYRSFGEQAALKSGYLVTYGTGANRFSADQGYSEHQLGTAVDLTTPKLGLGFTKFDGSAAYIWLTKNAYRYGFIISYPKQNTYFQYEPWHWRFVGVDLATKIHNNNQFFYDLPQREIDSYLIAIF
jgi:D-alanyl-D-alanine carboxypeptidase